MTPLDAHDLLRFALQFSEKLRAAGDFLAQKRKLEQEKAWMKAAVAALEEGLEGAAATLDKARDLSDLAPVRAEHAGALQNEWVDVLEKLVAGITFHAGSRAPLIETLLPHTKFPALRRPSRQASEAYWADFEKRLKLSYVTRILAQEDFAFARPVIDQVNAAWARYQSAFSGGGLAEEAAAPIREELLTTAKRVDLVLQQVKLLAQAALLPVKNAFEEQGLHAKPKKRSPKTAEGDFAEALAAGPEGVEGAVEAPAANENAPALSTEPAPLDAEAVPVATAPEVTSSVAPDEVAEPAGAAAPEAPAAEVVKVKKPRKPKPLASA